MDCFRFPPLGFNRLGDRYRLSLTNFCPSEYRSCPNERYFEPVMTAGRENPVLLSGFRYVDLAIQKDLPTIPVLQILPENSDVSDCWDVVWRRASERRYSSIEVAWGFSKFIASTGLDPVGAVSAYPDIFKEFHQEEMLAVGRMHHRFLVRLARYHLNVKQASLYANLDSAFRRVLYIVSHRLSHLTVSRIRELKDMLEDLAVATGREPESFLRSQAVRSVLHESNLSRVDKGLRIFSIIQHERFPEMIRYDEIFKRTLNGVKLPPSVSMQPPLNYEGDWLEFRFRISKVTELTDLLNSLKTQKDILKKLLKWLSDD
jgi:hypothetical protein